MAGADQYDPATCLRLPKGARQRNQRITLPHFSVSPPMSFPNSSDSGGQHQSGVSRSPNNVRRGATSRHVPRPIRSSAGNNRLATFANGFAFGRHGYNTKDTKSPAHDIGTIRTGVTVAALPQA